MQRNNFLTTAARVALAIVLIAAAIIDFLLTVAFTLLGQAARFAAIGFGLIFGGWVGFSLAVHLLG
jgi:hypothetical protein